MLLENKLSSILPEMILGKQSIHHEHSSPRVIQVNSTVFNVSSTTLGPIFRERHMTEFTSHLSNWTASGKGLRYAVVGKRAYFAVNIDNATMSKFNINFHLSVLAVGRNHIFVVKSFNESRTTEGLKVDFSYVPSIPGSYDLYVEEIGKRVQRQISSSPFRLRVTGANITAGMIRAESNDKPSCQTIPQGNYSWLDGDWTTRIFAGDARGTLRSGWVFRPKLCSFDIFTKDDLAAAAASDTSTTIAILGTSTERGIFLSMLDLVIDGKDKTNLKDSDVGKCWGYARVSFGSLSFVYQDFRIFKISSAKYKSMTCNGDKLASMDSLKLLSDAKEFMRNFLFEDPRFRPDVILIVVNNANQLRLMVNEIPDDWKGTIYPVHNFRSNVGAFYTIKGHAESMQKMNEFASVDPRVHTLNGFGLGAGMRHSTESSPLIIKSNHFHRWCNELDGEMRVCGNPTEMIAQMLLGKAIAPNGKKDWRRSLDHFKPDSIPRLDYNREFKVCYDCPTSMLPFHVKVTPELKCYSAAKTGFKIRNESEIRVWDGSLCPEDCMKTEPIDKINTESGTVDVRVCKVHD